MLCTVRRRLRRFAKSTLLITAIAAPLLAFTAAPADAAINRGSAYTVAGTNCTVTVGGFPNAGKYPGTASQVSCTTQHTIQLQNLIYYAGTNGVPVLFGQSGWSTYYNAYRNVEFDSYRASCAGRWYWLSGVSVYIDGVNRGTYYNSWGLWTACT